MFTIFDSQKSTACASVIDDIQNKFGKEKLFFCDEGIEQEWKPKSDYLTPSYTTNWRELPFVKVS